MASNPIRFAIFGNEYSPLRAGTVTDILRAIGDNGAEYFIDRPYYEYLTTTLHLDIQPAGVAKYREQMGFPNSRGRIERRAPKP